MHFTSIILRIVSALSVIYFLVLAAFSGIRTSFLWFWILLAAAALGLSLLIPRIPARFSGWFRGSFWSLVLVFVIFEGVLVFTALRRPKEAPEYVIILGAQVRGETPSKVLQDRITAAAEYLEEYPLAVAICSGGRGTGEMISEAEAIRRGLIEKGIEEERILLEDRSSSTVENILFSREIIGDDSLPVTVVSNNFHIFRAVQIAKKQGLTHVQGLGAAKFQPVTIHYYVREFFAVIKDFLVGNL